VQELVDGLRNAADRPPPSSIDLDRLITDESRRKRLRIGVTTVLAAAALAAVVAVPLIWTDGGGSTAPPVTEFAAPPGSNSAAPSGSTSAPPPAVCASPAPPDPAGGDSATLDRRVGPCLAAMLPGATLTNPDTKAPGLQFTGSRQDRYKALIQVDDAAGTGVVRFQYLLEPCRGVGMDSSQMCTGDLSNCPRPKNGGVECLVRPDGTKIFIQEGPLGPTQHNQINVYRPDRTYLQLESSNSTDPNGFVTDSMKATSTRPPLTSAQLIQIADTIHLDK
jgi:hypothetical protein